MEKEKLSKGFLISYIISYVLFFISIIIYICLKRIETGSFIGDILTGLVYLKFDAIIFCVSFLIMVLSIILGLKFKKKITNKVLKNRIVGMIWVILISYIFVILYLVFTIFLSNLQESKQVPEYDFNNVWSCSKYGSDSSRTYTFEKNGRVKAELDSNPEKYYLIGNYSIEEESVEDSLYTNEHSGKVKKYTVKINFEKFVTNGVNSNEDSVNWYISVYNGNYMKLTLAGGSYTCTMK